ncbi:peptidase [Amycolatopsis antarctica]|uniref:Peptidase n=1 Tax=Amycolatopsis antarctica TaxID=1854586 RepID=A0A263D0L4_9PSEU|nr:peptidase [Amycolatopsis antarctica]
MLLAALVPALLAGCTAGPSTRPPVVENEGPPPQQQTGPAEDVPLPPLAEPNEPQVQWNDCDEETRLRLGDPAVPPELRFSCSRLSTTLDAPDLPRRGLTRVAVLKVGTGPIPLAVVNDVSGDPGTLHAARLAATLPPAVLERFSLIGMDRRGTGESDAVRCIPDDVRARLIGHDPAATDVEPLLDAARKAGQQCSLSLESEQGAIDSWRAAGDLEELRQQLGMEHLNALSRGEGSRVLTAYAGRYTDRVGRFVLDGIPDPAPEAPVVQEGIAAGLQSTLDALGADCAARGCALGADAAGAVTALTTRLREDRGGSLTPALALNAVATGLAQRERWPELTDAIVAARNGDTGGLEAFAEPLLRESRVAPSRLDGTLATTCNDTLSRLPADRIDQITADLRAKYPVFGPIAAQPLAWCGPWPVRREPLPEPGAAGTPPVLVTSTAADPVTPEPGTARAVAQMPSAVRVAWQGAGHGAIGSPCVADAVRGFLVDGTIPRDGTLCPA